MKRHKINIKLIKLYVSTILKLPNTQLSHEKTTSSLLLTIILAVFQNFIGILKKWFIIIPKIQPKQPVVLFICSTLFNHPIQVFHPFNRPTWKKLATQRLQENTYRTWFFLFRRNPRNPRCGNTNSAKYSTK